jgi:hypothetical protein
VDDTAAAPISGIWVVRAALALALDIAKPLSAAAPPPLACCAGASPSDSRPRDSSPRLIYAGQTIPFTMDCTAAIVAAADP